MARNHLALCYPNHGIIIYNFPVTYNCSLLMYLSFMLYLCTVQVATKRSVIMKNVLGMSSTKFEIGSLTVPMELPFNFQFFYTAVP